jgi:hypothetical protein
MSHAYRSSYEHLVGTRVAQVQRAREVVAPLLPQLRNVAGLRLARALAGGVGLVGAAVTVALTCLREDASSTYALLGSSAAALATYVVSRALFGAFALVREPSRPAQALRLTGRLDLDLAYLDAVDPVRSLERREGEGASMLESLSLTLPLAALSLLMPLTLHYVFASVAARVVVPDGGGQSAAAFATWIRISCVVVGHAHLALMLLAIGFGRRLARSSREQFAAMRIHSEWGSALGITVAVATVPGILLLAVPPLLSALTGILFVPLMFIAARRWALDERAVSELAALSVRVEAAQASGEPLGEAFGGHFSETRAVRAR